MNLFGSGCGCNSSCDTLWYIILISLISSCGCGCGCGCSNNCQNGCGYEDNKCGCGCGIDLCTIIILLIVFGCCGKCCK